MDKSLMCRYHENPLEHLKSRLDGLSELGINLELINSYLFWILTLFISGFMVTSLLGQSFYRELKKSDVLKPMILGGLISFGVVTLAAFLLQSAGFHFDETKKVGLTALFFGSAIEEIAKLIGVLVFIWIFKVRPKQPIEALILIGSVALGYGLLENLIYLTGTKGLLIIPPVTMLPLQVICSVTAALVLPMQDVGSARYTNALLRALGISILFHLVSDLIQSSNLGLVALLVIAPGWFHQLLGYTLFLSSERKGMVELLNEAKASQSKEVRKSCLVCGTETTQTEFRFDKMPLSECRSCQSILVPEKNSIRFISSFLPNFVSYVSIDEIRSSDGSLLFPEILNEKYEKFRVIKASEVGPKVNAYAQELSQTFKTTSIFSFIHRTRPLWRSGDGILQSVFSGSIVVLPLAIIGVFSFVALVIAAISILR